MAGEYEEEKTSSSSSDRRRSGSCSAGMKEKKNIFFKIHFGPKSLNFCLHEQFKTN